MRPRSRLARKASTARDDEAGAIAVMASVIILAMLVATSLAVDVGRTAFVSRDQQGVTDRAALEAMSTVNAASDGGIGTLSGLHAAVEDAIEATLARNPGTDGGTATDREVGLVGLGRVQDGAFEAMCEQPYDQEAPATCAADATGDWTVPDVTAVRVVTESFVPFVFAIGDTEGGRDVVREAVAESMSLASITVGSELAGVEDGLLEDVLNGTVCRIAESTVPDDDPYDCDLSISAASYRGLATTDITLGPLVEELSAVVGSPDAVLGTDVTVAQFLTAAANVLDSQGDADQVAVLDQIIALPTDGLDVNLLEVVTLNSTTPDRAADATINVLEVVRGSLQVANGTNLLALPDLSAQLPAGLGSLTGDLSVIEAPSTAVGPVGDGTLTQAHTGQIDANLEGEVTLDLAGDLDDALSTLSLGSLDVDVEPVTVPISTQVAGATASLTGIDCAVTPEPDTIVQTSTDAARAVIGDFDPETGGASPADLTSVTIDISVLGVSLSTLEVDVDILADLPVGGTTGPDHRFDQGEYGDYPRGSHHTGGSVLETGDLEESNVELILSASDSIDDLDLILDVIEETLLDALVPLLSDLVGGIIDPMFESLGAGVGNADTWANWAHCRGRELAWIDPGA